MNIGAAASETGVSAKMIRYYEAIGLIPKVGRLASGYREYDTQDLHRLAFIKRARDLGFSINFIRELLALWSNKRRSNARVRKLARAHVVELESQAAVLRDMIRTLNGLIGDCQKSTRPGCPIIQELSADALSFKRARSGLQ